MATSKYHGLKFKKGAPNEVHDNLTVEEGLQVSINDKPLTITMRTPGNDLELVHGLLFSEDVYTDVENPLLVVLTKENNQGLVTGINLKIERDKLGSGYLNSRTFLSVASCGICGKTELENIEVNHSNATDNISFSVDTVQNMFKQMNGEQRIFNQSGGSHAAAAFDEHGNLLSIMEDIGRHNAVDKVIGDLILKKKLGQAKCLTVSGRISYEIIVKTFRAKIPILAAVSAPSSLSVDYAKELGISLLAFCREDRLTCYSHPHRLLSTINYQASTTNHVEKSE